MSQGSLPKTRLMKALFRPLGEAPYRDCTGLVLSVSGGMDSMVMLDLFVKLRQVHRSPLRVVHIHHQTGRFADVSRDLVQTWCDEHALPFISIDFGWDGTGNFEYEAAAFRRKALEGERCDGEYVLLGHHLDDQAETFFQTLVRGAGTTTPVGMHGNRDGRLRPMLGISRNLIAEHAEQHQVPHVLDPTNYDLNNFRNHVRHRLLPALCGFHDRVEERLGGWINDMQSLQNALELEAAELFERYYQNGMLMRDAFRACRPYLHDFLFKLFWEAQGLSKPKRTESEQFKSWLASDEVGRFSLGDTDVWLDSDGLTICPRAPSLKRDCLMDESISWGPWRWSISSDRHIKKYCIAPGSPLNAQTRDWLRRKRVPQRFRKSLPGLTLGEHHVSPLQFLQQQLPEGFHLNINPPSAWAQALAGNGPREKRQGAVKTGNPRRIPLE